VSFAVFVTNELQKAHLCCELFNNDGNDASCSTGLRKGTVALTPNKHGYTLLIFGLYPESIFTHQPVDLVGRWRMRVFSDVPLSDVIDTLHANYTEVDGECTEMDESHQVSRNVLTGSCEAVIVLEVSQPLSLTLIVTEDDVQVSSVRGIGFAVLPSCHIPGEKESVRLIVRGVSSELVTPVSWKLRIFSTAAVNCKEDTAPAEKTAAAIAAWEKKRSVKPTGGKKSEAKGRSGGDGVMLTPPEIDESVFELIEGEGVVLTEGQVEALLPNGDGAEDKAVSESSVVADPGDELRDGLAGLSNKMNETWDQYEAKRSVITKLFTPTPVKVDEK
jgi:hypothetical protein